MKVNKILLQKYAVRLNDDENIFNRVFAFKFKEWLQLGYGKSVYHASPYFQIGHHDLADSYTITNRVLKIDTTYHHVSHFRRVFNRNVPIINIQNLEIDFNYLFCTSF